MVVSGDLVTAFSQHQSVFGRLDLCINNAGIAEGQTPFWEESNVQRKGYWRRVLDINLTAVIDGTRLAVSLSFNFTQPPST